MIIQLQHPIALETPRGKAWAVARIEENHQPEESLWVTYLEESGECWTFAQPEVRAEKRTPAYAKDHVVVDLFPTAYGNSWGMHH